MAPKLKSISVVACANDHEGCNVMTPQCHVSILLKINMLFIDLPPFKRGKML